jgi:dTDP-4-dehydrorhamnose 3,5-epimerase-like enzyme
VIEDELPINIKRIFYMHRIVKDRGGHAHTDTDQVIIPMAGGFKMKVSDGVNTVIYEMNDPTLGIYVPRLIFIEFLDISHDAVCMVLASTIYDMSKSLRDWDSFIKYIK